MTTRCRTSARRALEDAGYTVIGEVPDGSSALAAIRAHRPDLVLADVRHPDIDGFAVAARATGLDDAPAVVLTARIPCGSRFAGRPRAS